MSFVTMTLKFILAIFLFLLDVSTLSGSSKCTTFLDESNGHWKINCSQTQVPTVVLEHILWLEPKHSTPQVIDVQVPNYKINELIKSGSKSGSSTGNTRVNILLKKPKVTYGAEIGPAPPQIINPYVKVKYEELKPVIVHYPIDKAYLSTDAVIPSPSPPPKYPEGYSPPTYEPPLVTEITIATVHPSKPDANIPSPTPPPKYPEGYSPPTYEPPPVTDETTIATVEPSKKPDTTVPETTPSNECIPKKKTETSTATKKPVEECLPEYELSSFGQPILNEDRVIVERPRPTTQVPPRTTSPPDAPSSGSGGGADESSAQVFYTNILKTFVNRGLLRTQQSSQLNQKTFEDDYCFPTIGNDTVYASLNPTHMKFVSQLQYIILQDSKSSEAKLRTASELLNYSDMNVEALYDAFVGVAFADSTLSTYDKYDRWTVIPNKFFHTGVIDNILVAFNLKQQLQDCIRSDESVGGRSEDSADENKLWYFREDPLVNAQHGIWHAANPSPMGSLPRSDRRGELFYYFHHHIIARYNAERLSNGLELVISFPLTENQTIQEGYDPNLRTSYRGSEYYNRRQSGQTFSDTTFINFEVSVQSIITYKERILEAIQLDRILDMNNNSIPLTDEQGIDFLGDSVEPGTFSHSNMGVYGNVHGFGHLVFSSINNRTGKQNGPGAMGDLDTAMRDPIFYRWHSMVDDIFNSWKSKLPPYTRTEGDHPLQWNGVKVVQFGVNSKGDSNPNQLGTFWNERKYKLLDDSVTICGKHLDHKEFDYEIGIESNLQRQTNATIRIFMAPKYKNNGERFTIAEQHLLFFVMDTFSISLEGEEVKRFTWPSTRTTLTSDSIVMNENKTQSCGCGWPHHLLLPKGRPDGMIFDLFIMVTEGSYPHYFDEANTIKICEREKMREQCRVAPLLCGFTGKKYPDILPMGYPFDRRPYSTSDDGTEIKYLENYIEGITNMRTAQVTITHKDDFSFL